MTAPASTIEIAANPELVAALGSGLGSEVFATLEDYPPGEKRFFMRKSLAKGGRECRNS